MPDIAGLKLIVPTSVAGSGVSVSASGKVTFTAATTINVNGCFTSSYDNYLVVIRHALNSGSDSVSLRLRLSGTDASGSDYTRQTLLANSTTVSGGRVTTTLWRSADTNSSPRCGSHFYFYGPALSQPTAFRSVNVSGESGALLGDYAATHGLSTAYDGFTWYVASGNLTGALTIYGLSQ